MSEKRPRGRQTIYTAEIAETICRQLSEGKSLRSICRTPGYPHESTVRLWVVDNVNDFATHYARARDVGLDVMAESLIDIADEPVGTLLTGGTDSGAVNKQRLQVDTRKWILSKLAPKKYGDRQTLAHEGGIALTVVTGVDG